MHNYPNSSIRIKNPEHNPICTELKRKKKKNSCLVGFKGHDALQVLETGLFPTGALVMPAW